MNEQEAKEWGIPILDAKVRGTDTTGVFAVSFVDFPAIESNFIALAKQAPQRPGLYAKMHTDKQKQILTGPLIIPDQLIYRYEESRGEYLMRFTRDEIEKISLKMMKTGEALHNSTHQHEKRLDGNHIAELWIVQDAKKDKSNALGMGEFPAGTLMLSYKINDAKYWREQVLTGNVRGFSLEGFFNFNEVKMNKTKTKTAAQLANQKIAAKSNKVSSFLRSMATMLEGDTSAEADDLADEADKDGTDSGTPVMIFTLSDGGEIQVDSDGFCTLNGEQMAAGEHTLDDGNVIVIGDDGILVVTQPEPTGEGEEQATVEATKQKAKETGKAFLAQMKPASKKPAAKLSYAELLARVEKLEKEPSAPVVKPEVENPADTTKMSFSHRMAVLVKQQQQKRTGGAKKD